MAASANSTGGSSILLVPVVDALVLPTLRSRARFRAAERSARLERDPGSGAQRAGAQAREPR